MIKKIRIRGIRLKLLGPLSAQLITLVLICGLFLHFTYRISTDLKQTALVRLPLAQYSARMSSAVHEVVRYSWSVYGAGLDIGARKRFVDLAYASMNRFEEAQKGYESLPSSSDQIHDLYAKMVPVGWQKFREQATKALKALEKNDPRYDEMAKYYLASQVRPAAEPITETLDKIDDMRAELIRHQTEEALASVSTALKAVPIFSVTAFLIALGILVFVTESLISRLLKITRQLSLRADEVGITSRIISVESGELSNTTSQQAEVLQKTASAVNEVSSMVSVSADNAASSVKLSQQSHAVASRGREVVEDVIHAMEEINRSNAMIMSQVEVNNRENTEIVRLISEIGSKTKVINDIVFQTRLLSFNASVEAARAGEHGKGFAVVAEEVGNLAQMSGSAAREIGEMLEGSIGRVDRIARETTEKIEGLLSEGKAKVENGVIVAKRCGEVLEEIVRNAGEVNQMLNQISNASREQAVSVQEITNATTQLDEAMQKGAAVSSSAAESARELTRQAEVLTEMVVELATLVEGAPEVKKGTTEVAVPLRLAA